MKNIQLAGCVILNDKKEVLLIHRSLGRIQWELPGGKVEDKETLEQTAVREILEEIGVRVVIVKKLGEGSFGEKNEMHYTWFLAKVIQGKPSLQEAKYNDLQYFSWQALKEMSDLSLNVRNLVEAYFEKRFTI